MTKTLEFALESSSLTHEELDEQRLTTIEQAMAGRTINLCTKREGQVFVNPLVAFTHYREHNNEDHTSNVD